MLEVLSADYPPAARAAQQRPDAPCVLCFFALKAKQLPEEDMNSINRLLAACCIVDQKLVRQ